MTKSSATLPDALAFTSSRSSASTVPVAYTASTAVPRTIGVATTGTGRLFAATTPPTTARRARGRTTQRAFTVPGIVGRFCAEDQTRVSLPVRRAFCRPPSFPVASEGAQRRGPDPPRGGLREGGRHAMRGFEMAQGPRPRARTLRRGGMSPQTARGSPPTRSPRNRVRLVEPGDGPEDDAGRARIPRAWRPREAACDQPGGATLAASWLAERSPHSSSVRGRASCS